MGWSFDIVERSKKEFIAELTDDRHFADGYKYIDHRVVGNHLWTLAMRPDGSKFISLDLIAKERNGGYGNKSMSEDSGPYYYDCPLSLLDKTSPTESINAIEWRGKVREYHARNKNKAQPVPGMIVTSYGQEYKLVEPCATRRGWIVIGVWNNQKYRMPASHLSKALVEN